MGRWWQTLVRDGRRELAAVDLRGDRQRAVTTSVASLRNLEVVADVSYAFRTTARRGKVMLLADFSQYYRGRGGQR